MVNTLRERLLWLSMVLSFSIGCDQTTKRIAEHTLSDSSHSFLFDTVRLHFIKNSGAFLGFGSNFSPDIKLWLFFILPMFFLIGAVFYTIFSKNLSLATRIMITLMVSGGIGNLIDRIFLAGQVTDFINLGIGTLRTGIFNIADVAIMAGAFGMLFTQSQKPQNTVEE
jgi:signal peptidase II